MKTSNWETVQGGVSAPQGFKATGVKAKVRYQDKYDVALIYSEVPAKAAGVFTRNRVKAHPLLLSMKHLQNGEAQVIVANSGNANACVGEVGDAAALAMAEEASRCFNVPTEQVLVASTGVIGVPLPVEKVLSGIREAGTQIENLNLQETEEHSKRAALAIMTTDTFSKEVSYELQCQEGAIRIGGIAKGSGMIHPNMGTMLGFFTTDAIISTEELQQILSDVVEETFNMITVDGDTSTNDMVLFLANGRSGVSPKGKDLENFKEMVKAAFISLAKAIAEDGEGATKLLEVQVSGAKSLEDARKIAKSICSSSLVKTALFGEDANWGRILAAAGYSGAEFNPDNIVIYLGELLVAKDGCGIQFSEEKAKEILGAKQVLIKVELNEGGENATAWGCDLTHEYVTINGSYRT